MEQSPLEHLCRASLSDGGAGLVAGRTVLKGNGAVAERAWQAAALCSTLAEDEETRAELAEILGSDPDEAAALACELLAEPHTLVKVAAGL